MPKYFTELLTAQQRAGQIANERSTTQDFEVWLYHYADSYRLSTVPPQIYCQQRPTARCAGYYKAGRPRKIRQRNN